MQAIATGPEFLWELSLSIWPIVMGFNPSALASLSTKPDADGVLRGSEQPDGVPSNGHPAPSKV